MRLGIRAGLPVSLLTLCAANAACAQKAIKYPGLPRYELGAEFHALQLNGALTGPGQVTHLGTPGGISASLRIGAPW